MHGKPARNLLRRGVVARHAVDHDDATVARTVVWLGEVRLDFIPPFPLVVTVSAPVGSGISSSSFYR
jgi:hypothetical protein